MAIDSINIDFPCPNCSFLNKVTLRQIRFEEKIICSGCHAEIALKDKEGSVQKSVTDIQEALDELERSVKKASRKFELRL